MDDLLADFVAETKEMLEASEGEIIAWEADPSDRARLDAIFRFVHTVKGNCGFFDFPQLEKLSHAAEDALAEVRAGRRAPDAALVTAVLSIIDRIAEMADMIEAGEKLPDDGDEALIAALEENASEVSLPAAAPAAEGEANGPRRTENSLANARTIRLPVELLDRVMSGVSDMVLARNDLGHRLRQAGAQPTIDGPFERLSSILNDVRDAATRMRMHRIEHLFSAFPRLVRDLSAELGKQVMIDIEGGDVELDREMIEMIRDPMVHIIRNAIDHGLEGVSERLSVAKREIGMLSISARQAGNKISVIVSDDGRGLNATKIGAKAVATGVISQSELDAMSVEEVQQLIFTPGLSTADAVSAVSGRGVGLDVVRDNLARIGGSIQVSSTEGSGTTFHLRIPLTLSIIAGLILEVDGQRFAIPQSNVEEILSADAGGLKYANVGQTTLIEFRGSRTPCLSLAKLLELEHSVPEEQRTLVLLRLAGGNIYALAVDRIHGIGDIVVKPLPPVVVATNLYGGSTLLDDGTPILLLDMALLAQKGGLSTEARAVAPSYDDGHGAENEKAHLRAMLFTARNGRKQAVRLELVRRIETIDANAIDLDGDIARATIEDEIVPLVGLVDGEMPAGRIRLLRLSDGSCDVLYAISDVVDAVELDQELVEVEDGSMVEAVTLVDGASVELIDGHKLFAMHGRVPRRKAALTCRVPDNEWANRILAPLLDSAGYSVTSSSEAEADIAILMDDAEEAKGSAGSVIHLRSQPDDAVSEEERDKSIYRYDRDRLLAALHRIRNGEAA